MADEPIINAEIDIRSSFTPFDYPSLPEVIQAIERQLPEDRLKVVKQLRGPLLGLYRLTSNNYDVYKDASITIRNVKIPVTLRRRQPKQQQDRPGRLVTIYDAFDGRTQEIPGSRFNEHFGHLNVTFIRQTTPQFHKGTRILNGNRYLVLDFDADTVDLGESIMVDGFKFKINYFGQKKLCYLCQQKHGALCPEKEKFKELIAAREGKITHKIYSDSTMRQVNQLALAANVTCTSGAGIGQLANLIAVDPDKTADILIIAGANEIRQTEDERQYQYQVTKASEKLHKLSATRNITLVLPPTPRTTLEEEVKYEVLKQTMTELKSITVVDIPPEVVPYEGLHPTKDGTAALVGYIQQAQEMNIVLNNDYLTTDRIYSQVHSYFKVGCRTCDSHQYTNSICAACEEASKSVDITRMYEIAKEIYERDNPPLADDVDMKDILKRPFRTTATDNTENENESGEVSKRVKVGND